MVRYVIVGNGFAGINAIESIRALDKEGEIILISDEEDYSKPLITYYLGKKVKASALPYRDDKFYESKKVVRKIGPQATKLDVEKRTLTLDNGEVVEFDKLLIATGGTPFVPPIEGADAKGVFTLTNYKNARAIEDYIDKYNVKKAIVLGGGLIGLKTTEAFMERGISTTVVELADRILSATFDKTASKIFEEALQEQNCAVFTEDTISKINTEDGRVKSVTLRSGVVLEADIVVIAIGVRPNVELVKDTPIKVERGIVVNEYMETSVPDIFAAGDCAQASTGVIAIIPVAARQGKIAGHNMAVKDIKERRSYEGGIPMNSVSLAGIPTISAGLTDPKENIEEYEILQKFDPVKKTYKKIVLKDNIIVGAIFVNEIDRAGIYTGLIKEHMDVTPFKDELMKDSFGLISLPKNYRKHKVQGPGIEI